MGAAKPADLARVVVDTTVQPKAIAFPTDAKPLHRARELLARLAHRHGVRLRQSYTRLGKIALIRHQRYAHAKQLKRANRMLQTLRTQLGRVIRDIVRKIAGNAELRAIFARPLSLASQVRSQKQRQRGPKIYSQHAPEVACIGKGKAHRPYEFGVKVSVATTLNRSKGGQFVAHVAALPGNPYDGHTLASVIPAITQQIGVSLTQVIADAGYRGHNAPSAPGLRVFTAAQKRGVTQTIKGALRRRGRSGTRDRPPQGRAPHGPQLRQTSRRCGQCAAGRRWVQLPVAAGPAGGAFSCCYSLGRQSHGSPRPDRVGHATRSEFFADDGLASAS